MSADEASMQMMPMRADEASICSRRHVANDNGQGITTWTMVR